MARRPERPLFFPFLLVLLLLALVGLAGCASVPDSPRAPGPSNGAPENLPLLTPPPRWDPEGFNGIPVFPRGRGTDCESPPRDEPSGEPGDDKGDATGTRPPTPASER